MEHSSGIRSGWLIGLLIVALSSFSSAQPTNPVLRTLDQSTANTLRRSIDDDIANHKDLNAPVLPDGTTYLYMAVGEQDQMLVRRLLENGASARSQTPEGDPIVLLATFHGDPNIVELLIKHGADINTVDAGGNELLFAAIILKHEPLVERLIQLGANVNARGTNEFTPLMMATAFGNTSIIERLIAKGADVNARAEGGLTPLNMAQKVQGYEHIVLLLKRHGAM